MKHPVQSAWKGAREEEEQSDVREERGPLAPLLAQPPCSLAREPPGSLRVPDEMNLAHGGVRGLSAPRSPPISDRPPQEDFTQRRALTSARAAALAPPPLPLPLTCRTGTRTAAVLPVHAASEWHWCGCEQEWDRMHASFLPLKQSLVLQTQASAKNTPWPPPPHLALQLLSAPHYVSRRHLAPLLKPSLSHQCSLGGRLWDTLSPQGQGDQRAIRFQTSLASRMQPLCRANTGKVRCAIAGPSPVE